MSAHDDDRIDDALPTTIDPEVPTGVRARPAKFDPHARLKDNRAPAASGGRAVAAEVIAALPPVRHDPPGPSKQRAPSSFDPHARIDDSSRTAKWAPRELESAMRGEEQRSSTEAPTRVEGFNRKDEPAPSRAEVPTRVEGLGRKEERATSHADESARRAKAPTRRGHDAAAPAPRAATAPPHGHEAPTLRASTEPPHGHDAAAPVPPRASTAPPHGPPGQRDRSEPIRVISMKTPADLEAEKAQRVLPVVKLRAISDVHQTPPRGMGNLAPPRDPRESRSRRVRDNIIWGSVAVILASAVTLAIWFLARR